MFDNGYINEAECNEYKKDAYELVKILNVYIAKTKQMKEEYESE